MEIEIVFDNFSLYEILEDLVSNPKNIEKSKKLNDYLSNFEDFYEFSSFKLSLDKQIHNSKKILPLYNPDITNRDDQVRIQILFDRFLEKISINNEQTTIKQDITNYCKEKPAILFHCRKSTPDISNDFTQLQCSNKKHVKKIISLFLEKNFSNENFWIWTDFLYENIYFSNKSKGSKLQTLEVDLNKHLKTILDHLHFLDFYGQNNYIEDKSKFLAFSKSKNINISPDSPKTHKNKKAKNERTININNESLVCEWHTKITPQKGRIHFHFGLNLPKKILETTKKKLIIGLFTGHLTN